MENKETVIIVHGTWANPTSTATRASLTTTSGATRHPPALSAGDMTPRNAAAFSYVNVQFRFTRGGGRPCTRRIHAGASIDATRTSFLLTNSSMPMLESSRP